MKVQNSEYAMARDPVYHAHVDCPIGRIWRAKASVRGPHARDGRRYCEACQRMDVVGPSRTPGRPASR